MVCIHNRLVHPFVTGHPKTVCLTTFGKWIKAATLRSHVTFQHSDHDGFFSYLDLLFMMHVITTNTKLTLIRKVCHTQDTHKGPFGPNVDIFTCPNFSVFLSIFLVMLYMRIFKDKQRWDEILAFRSPHRVCEMYGTYQNVTPRL